MGRYPRSPERSDKDKAGGRGTGAQVTASGFTRFLNLATMLTHRIPRFLLSNLLPRTQLKEGEKCEIVHDHKEPRYPENSPGARLRQRTHGADRRD